MVKLGLFFAVLKAQYKFLTLAKLGLSIKIRMYKKQLFWSPKTFSITDEIIKNLEFMGFEVIDITFDQQYKYKKYFSTPQ